MTMQQIGMILKEEKIQMLKRLGLIAAGIVAVVILVTAVEWKGGKLVSDVVIEVEPLEKDALLITTGDIQKVIDRSFGIPLNALAVRELEVDRLERVLEEEPFILDAEAYVDAKNRVNIHVTQREPVLRVIDNNGLNYYLDVNGVKMPLSAHFSARVLVATGNVPPHTPEFLERKKNTLKDVFELAAIIREDELLMAMIEQIHVSNRGELTLVAKMGPTKILFGQMNEVDDKLKRLRIFYDEVTDIEGWRKYRAVDLRYKGQVVGVK